MKNNKYLNKKHLILTYIKTLINSNLLKKKFCKPIIIKIALKTIITNNLAEVTYLINIILGEKSTFMLKEILLMTL
jgi:hypothetical protein